MAKIYKGHFTSALIETKNYIAELMCIREASKQGIELCHGFWNLDKWKRIYQQHLLAAHTLIRVYKEEAIVIAIRKTPKLFSLRAKWFHDIVKKIEIELNQKQETLNILADKKEEVKQVVIEKPREAFTTKKSVFDKLKDM